ncbi:glutathione S-transferase, partial [Escherichia coli]
PLMPVAKSATPCLPCSMRNWQK